MRKRPVLCSTSCCGFYWFENFGNKPTNLATWWKSFLNSDAYKGENKNGSGRCYAFVLAAYQVTHLSKEGLQEFLNLGWEISRSWENHNTGTACFLFTFIEEEIESDINEYINGQWDPDDFGG